MKRRRKFQRPKIFVIKDIHGTEWTTKTGLKYLCGVYAVDSKEYFYEVKSYGKNLAASCDS